MKRICLVSICFLSLILVAYAGNGVNNSDKNKEKIVEQIKKRGKVVVGTEAAFVPYEFVENGKIVGYGPDILHEIVKNMDVELEQLDLAFSGILPGLNSKKFDFVATAIAVTPERQEKFGLTVPIGDSSIVIVKRKGNDRINSIEDLSGKIVACTTGSAGEKKLKQQDEKFKAEGKEGFKEIVYFKSDLEKFIDLKNGRIDASLQNLPMTNKVMQDEPDTYEIVDRFGEPMYSAWAVRKEDEDLLKLLNEEILKLKKSGKLAELQMKWFGATFDLPDQLPNK